MFLFSIFVFIMSAFLKRAVLIEKIKSEDQKREENLHLVIDKIIEEIRNRERKGFLYNGENGDLHIGHDNVVYKKGSSFYKLEYLNKKLYISEGLDLSNMGSKNIMGEYSEMEFIKDGTLLLIKIKMKESEEIKVLNLN